MIEKIPFMHRQRMYNIIIEDDISFVALHHILDQLIDMDAFRGGINPAELHTVPFEDVCYTVGVDGIDVIVVIR
ncbi:MAG TPA: hypothetical protein ENN34_08390 [Deltaproteobacteria bacterium]|nr:hypothetical protein [Deltaproteobacteria bacterium]